MIRFVFLFFSLTCSCSFADSYSSKDLENFAQRLVFDNYNSKIKQNKTEKLYLKVAPIDKRISYPYCDTGLVGEVVNNKIKPTTAVKVSCADKEPWNIYLRVRVNILLKAVIVKRALSKGQVLTPNNITSVYMDKSRIRNGGFSSVEPLFGVRLKRNLSADRVIKNRDVCFVCKGDKVTISATKTGLSITASGIALSDANIGGTVRVKNSRTQRVIVGTVSDLKKVDVSF